jgi:hypothetical protein
MPAIDFTNVEVTGFELLPRGDYLLRVVTPEIRDSQSSEHQYLNIEFEVVDGEFAGRKIWDSMSFSPGALWKLKGFLLASGYTEEDLAGSFDFDPADLANLEVQARVAQKADNRQEGVMRNVVNSYTQA